jgi:hypothetical protein
MMMEVKLTVRMNICSISKLIMWWWNEQNHSLVMVLMQKQSGNLVGRERTERGREDR